MFRPEGHFGLWSVKRLFQITEVKKQETWLISVNFCLNARKITYQQLWYYHFFLAYIPTLLKKTDVMLGVARGGNGRRGREGWIERAGKTGSKERKGIGAREKWDRRREWEGKGTKKGRSVPLKHVFNVTTGLILLKNKLLKKDPRSKNSLSAPTSATSPIRLISETWKGEEFGWNNGHWRLFHRIFTFVIVAGLEVTRSQRTHEHTASSTANQKSSHHHALVTDEKDNIQYVIYFISIVYKPS